MKQHRTLVAQLLQRLEDIAQNTNYPQEFSERCLVDPQTYLNLCRYVYPQLEGYIEQIQMMNASPADKLDLLLDLLSEALRIDLSKLEGSQILRLNFSHIQRFIMILHQSSKMIKDAEDVEVRSDNNQRDNTIQKQKPKSARGPSSDFTQGNLKNSRGKDKQKREKKTLYREDLHKKQNHEQQHRGSNLLMKEKEHVHFAQQDDYLMPAQDPNGKPPDMKKKKSRKIRNQQAERQNLHSCVVNALLDEKTRMHRAGIRDTRKNKMEDIEESKQGYRTYLKRFTKDNKAKNNRDIILGHKSASAVKPLKNQLPQADFEKVDNFFQSFACKFRDKKAAYIRKLTCLIRKQELDRFCYHNRIERETRKYMQQKLQQELEGLRHQHRVKSALIRESAQSLESEISSMKKEQKRLAASQRKELKEVKMKELQQIQNVLKEDNERVLMGLEQGGQLEQMILKMYKKM